MDSPNHPLNRRETILQKLNQSFHRQSNDNNSQVITLNVGGFLYTTFKETLSRKINGKDHLLSIMFSETCLNFDFSKDERGNIFIDRNGKVFSYVLDYLRAEGNIDKFSLPFNDVCLMEQLEMEVEYFSLIDLSILLRGRRKCFKIEKKKYTKSKTPTNATITPFDNIIGGGSSSSGVGSGGVGAIGSVIDNDNDDDDKELDEDDADEYSSSVLLDDESEIDLDFESNNETVGSTIITTRFIERGLSVIDHSSDDDDEFERKRAPHSATTPIIGNDGNDCDDEENDEVNEDEDSVSTFDAAIKSVNTQAIPTLVINQTLKPPSPSIAKQKSHKRTKSTSLFHSYHNIKHRICNEKGEPVIGYSEDASVCYIFPNLSRYYYPIICKQPIQLRGIDRRFAKSHNYFEITIRSDLEDRIDYVNYNIPGIVVAIMTNNQIKTIKQHHKKDLPIDLKKETVKKEKFIFKKKKKMGNKQTAGSNSLSGSIGSSRIAVDVDQHHLEESITSFVADNYDPNAEEEYGMEDVQVEEMRLAVEGKIATAPFEIGQWVKEVLEYSSQYSPSWTATNIIGKSYSIEEVDSGQVDNDGNSIRKNQVTSKPEDWIVLYQGNPQQSSLAKESRIFVPPIKKYCCVTKIIKIEMDTTDSESWSEIDAIRMFGIICDSEVVDAMAPVSTAVHHQSKEYVEDLKTLFINEPSTDCVSLKLPIKKKMLASTPENPLYIVSPKLYYVHEFLLRYRFHNSSILDKYIVKSEDEITDMSPSSNSFSITESAANSIINYLYSGSLFLSPSMFKESEENDYTSSEDFVREILQISNAFGIETLKEACTQTIEISSLIDEKFRQHVTISIFNQLASTLSVNDLYEDMRAVFEEACTKGENYDRRAAPDIKIVFSLSDVKYEIFLKMIKFIYCGILEKGEITPEEAIPLYVAQNQYLLDSSVSASVIKENLSETNVMEILGLAVQFSYQEISEFCTNYLMKNIERVYVDVRNRFREERDNGTLNDDPIYQHLKETSYIWDLIINNDNLHYTSQWAYRLIGFSSEYNGWPATNVIGPSNTYPDYGDIKTAWAPKPSKNSKEFLELEFYNPTFITEIRVYETYNPGALVMVTAVTESQKEQDVIFEHEPVAHLLPAQSRINVIPISDPKNVMQRKYKYLRLDIDTSKNYSWYEIDAVLLCGFIEKK
ncbi:predicted protein [Naegleria gruberi]|uniref:Predicted protein n=1 Tax=Naegleria gruberi TaxID=5762 RepID=D2V8N7_NAEGR|nr:uncharacterized protein NAEGRDRAFT_47557 [Naegleria gruberi]EFC46723.1 predicted protein [Naegleria gruberi]|eukprot:XP_002679467.1 predicted protein [Naegleria gruberi strain NEG-M]